MLQYASKASLTHKGFCWLGSFENEALENEDRSTKHPSLENEAPKSRTGFVFEIWVLRASAFIFECFVFETTLVGIPVIIDIFYILLVSHDVTKIQTKKTIDPTEILLIRCFRAAEN